MSSTIKIKAPAMPEPSIKASAGVCCGNFTTGGEHMGQSETLCCGQPDEAYPDHYSADQLAARDAQWQEMVGPILKELKDAATSLETIGRLAGFAEYVGDDGERVPTYMKHGDEIRGYAKSRASAARAALSAITEE